MPTEAAIACSTEWDDLLTTADDPNKTEPGQCGCGFADTNRLDGTNCNDDCPMTMPVHPINSMMRGVMIVPVAITRVCSTR